MVRTDTAVFILGISFLDTWFRMHCSGAIAITIQCFLKKKRYSSLLKGKKRKLRDRNAAQEWSLINIILPSLLYAPHTYKSPITARKCVCSLLGKSENWLSQHEQTPQCSKITAVKANQTVYSHCQGLSGPNYSNKWSFSHLFSFIALMQKYNKKSGVWGLAWVGGTFL